MASENNKITTIGLGIAVGVVFAVVALWYFYVPPEDQTPRHEKVITVGYSPYILNLPVFVALEEGFFEPYKVEVKRFNTTNALTDAVVRGDLDLASATGTELFIRTNELRQGVLRPVMFNAFTKERWSEAFLVGSEVEADTIDYLQDKSVGTIPASTAVAYVNLIGKNVGVRFQAIQEIPPDQALQALANGEVDALFAIEPQVAFARLNSIGRVLVNAPLARFVHDPLLAGAHVVSEKTVAEDPEKATAIYEALEKASILINTDSARSLNHAQKYTGMELDVLTKTSLPQWLPSCLVDRKDLHFVAAIFFDADILETSDSHYDELYCPED